MEPIVYSLAKVDFHIHSNFSDGMFSPEILADELAVAAVGYAALTDHDSIEGLRRFERAVSRWGIQSVNGVEMSVSHAGTVLHLLGYGFDRTHKQLKHELTRSYRLLHPGASAWIRKAQQVWCRMCARKIVEQEVLISMRDAIQLMHDAGGLTFLAHPLMLYQDAEHFDALLCEFKEQGLDGVEAYYKQYSDQQVQLLLEHAQKHGLLTCAGSDFHGTIRPRLMDPGLLMPEYDWVGLREVLGMNETSELINIDESNRI